MTEQPKKTPLAGVGLGLWLSGFALSIFARSMMPEGEIPPFTRGMLLASGLIQLGGSAVLLFCFFRFLYRKAVGGSSSNRADAG